MMWLHFGKKSAFSTIKCSLKCHPSGFLGTQTTSWITSYSLSMLIKLNSVSLSLSFMKHPVILSFVPEHILWRHTASFTVLQQSESGIFFLLSFGPHALNPHSRFSLVHTSANSPILRGFGPACRGSEADVGNMSQHTSVKKQDGIVDPYLASVLLMSTSGCRPPTNSLNAELSPIENDKGSFSCLVVVFTVYLYIFYGFLWVKICIFTTSGQASPHKGSWVKTSPPSPTKSVVK